MTSKFPLTYWLFSSSFLCSNKKSRLSKEHSSILLRNKYASLQPKLAILINLGTNLSHQYLLQLPSLTSKTREMAFQVLNRTVWTSNKAFKSCVCDLTLMLNSAVLLKPWCIYFVNVILLKTTEGSALVGNIITQYPINREKDLVPRVELGQINIIFNILSKDS
jgi:hypothetical protein